MRLRNTPRGTYSAQPACRPPLSLRSPPYRSSLASCGTLCAMHSMLMPNTTRFLMSSSIDRLVPIFGGDNYPGWAVTIESYLMSLGIWGVIEDFFESDSRPVYLSAAAQTSGGSALPGQFSALSASAPASGPAASSADSATGTSTSAAGGGADIFNKAATAPADALKEKKKDKEEKKKRKEKDSSWRKSSNMRHTTDNTPTVTPTSSTR